MNAEVRAALSVLLTEWSALDDRGPFDAFVAARLDEGNPEEAEALAADLAIVAVLDPPLLLGVAEWMIEHGWTEPLR